MDYFDILLAKKLEDDRDPKVEGLSVNANGRYHEDGVVYDPVIVNVPETPLSKLTVTENGTYTAPSGTAYNEVEVDVPLPENAYLLKEIEDVEIATFPDGSDLPMPKLEVAIEPVQDLHGYDAPWVGGAGKNKAKPYSYTVTAPNEVTFTYNGDGSVTLNGTATASQAVPSVSVAVQNDLTFTLGSGTWIPSVSANNVTYEVYDTATSTLLSNGASFTLTEAKTVIFRVGAVNGQTYNNLKVYMQIESGSTATSYAPYSNICPISGWDEVNVTRCGKNLVDWKLVSFSSTVNTPIILKQGTYTLSQSEATNTGNYYIQAKKSDGTYLTKTELGLSDWNASSTEGVYYGASNARSFTFTITEDNVTVKIGCQTPASTIPVQLEIGSTATAYEPYNPNSTIYTIDLDGTRYGGKVDLVSGVMVVDRVEVDLGSLNWSKYGDDKFYTSISDIKMPETSADRNKGMICSNYKPSSTLSVGDMEDGAYLKFNQAESFWIRDSRYTDATAFKTAMNGVKLVYELATPLTIQLTPTVVKSMAGVNNISADSGDILDLSYLAKEV